MEQVEQGIKQDLYIFIDFWQRIVMNNGKDVITSAQASIIAIVNLIGIGVLSLPRIITKAVHQDGWIVIILGSIYPLYIIAMASYMKKKYPNDNIIAINKKIYGKFIGTVISIGYLVFFIILGTSLVAGMSNILIVYSCQFLKHENLIIMTYLVIAYTTYKGIETIGKTGEIIFWVTCIVYSLPFFAFIYGDFNNIRPVFETNIVQLLKSIKITMLDYAGTEALFLIYPFVENKKKFTKDCFLALGFVISVFTLYTIVTVVYLGTEACTRFMWPVVTVTESISIPVLNNFRYIFMGVWSIHMIMGVCIYYFSSTQILGEIVPKIKRRNWGIIIYPIMAIISIFYKNQVRVGKVYDKVIPLCVLYNVIIIFITAVLVAIKSKNKVKQKKKKEV